MAAPVARRGVLQGGALAGGLAALGQMPARPAAATVRPDPAQPLTGSIAGHIRLSLANGATIRLVELDQHARLTRELAFMTVPLAMIYPGGKPTLGGGPLRAVSEQANALAIRVAAATWQVEPDQCGVSGNRIVHAASRRTIGYSAWVDVI